MKLPASPPPTFLTWAVTSPTWGGKRALLETMHPSPHTMRGFDFNRTSIAMTKSGNGVGVGVLSEVEVCVAAEVSV